MKYVWIVVGLLAVIAGLLMTLGGLNVMSDVGFDGTTWAIVGPIVAVVGALGFLFGLRRRDGA